ncbi:ATP-binding protein [Micromonospora sp. WMMA1923]|uniref:ATP-binding protein n=1 Tax=Micromonospora sp. WMMA1923 TaxID=3404125 RepID=UPI003B92AE2E
MTPVHDRSGRPDGRAALPDLLRGHRRSAGLTQAELAALAGVGVRTIRDLERGRAARPQRTTVELIAGALGLTGVVRTAFLAAARGTGSAPAAPTDPMTKDLDGTRTALPAAVELTGREQDVAELTRLVTGDRHPPVVSLVGLAGVGKTALALRVAHTVAAEHPGGVAGVLVGEGSDVGDVLAAVAASFGVSRDTELATRIAGRPALLLVDAVERAPDPVAAALTRLGVTLPDLRIIVTGRHPVGVPAERVWPVPPLDVPPPDFDPDGPAALAAYPAAALFTTRLAQVRREPPRPAELPALAALVRRLGGLPLAIELMAARGRILDLNELLDRYGDRVLDLARPPERIWPEARGGLSPAAVTLREAVATSYRLLAPDERTALRRLSVFRDRWSVELAEELLADPDGTPVDRAPMLDRLHELGLLSVASHGSFRFRLVDAVREFAAEQAAGAGEATAVRRRHAEIVTRLVVRTAPELTGAGLAAAVRRLDEVSSDIATALGHAAVDDPVTALRLAASLTRWWRFRGRDVQGRQWLRRLLADPRTADADPVLRAWAALGVARLAAEHRAGAAELPGARAALAAFTAAGDVDGELAARAVLSSLLIAAGAPDEARQQAEAVLTLATGTGRVRDTAVAQNNLTWHDIRLGDLVGARRRLAAAERLAAQCAEQRLRLLVRANLAEVARLEGRYVDAVDQGRRTAAALVELGDPGHRRRVLGTVGLALAQDGRWAEAAEVLAELRSSAGGGRVDTAAGSPTRGDRSTGTAIRPEDGICALIEGNVALLRGDRELATEWFAAAAEAATGGQDRRDVVEALVGLAASTGDAEVLDRLERVCRDSGIRLLPQEEGLLYALRVTRPGPQGGWRERLAP